MKGKIKKFPDKRRGLSKKKLIETLILKYPRVERWGTEFEEIHSEAEEGVEELKVSSTLFEQGYIEYGRMTFESIFRFYLEHVIYRCLKEVYGTPDVLKFKILEKDNSKKDNTYITGWPTEWGYLVDIGDGNILEILKEQRFHHPDIIIWLHLEKKPEKMPEALVRNSFEFFVLLTELAEIIDNDYSLEKELEKADKVFKNGGPRIVINKFYQNFQAGKDLLELSEEWISEIDETNIDLMNQGKWAESSDLHRKGNILYVSSIIYFLMAMEGFINLLYKFFLKPQFKNKEEYERAIWRHHDLEMRILHLPVYCNGFSNANFGPDDVSYKQWLELRKFRNDLLHANITEENEFAITFEDYFHFQYNPMFHSKKIKRKNKILHTQQLYIRRNDVIKVQECVQKFVYGIIEKMDEAERAFMNSWIDRLEIWYQGNMKEISLKPFEIIMENKK